MELIEHDFIQDEVGVLERILAQKLKDLCDSDGKEMPGTKLRAARILCHLAKVYELKPNQKKLNMIRSAALYNAAIVRDPENQIIKDELKALCSVVLVKAYPAKFDADLISLASTLKKNLKAFRKYFGESYNQLEKIPYGVEGDQLIQLQKKKYLDVKYLQQEVTMRYTELMMFISDECIEIMGTPPCKYAVVGLGSLARSEITLYSDFEHIIVLDNDAAKIEERKMIMKYFRWFTTIFNIILINLGETMINCVAIPSLNPRYRVWFTDIVTPDGVTFDGIVAHRCIRPLGRPATKNRPYTEFIKPVDEMIQYLDSEEQLKQGYHVAEVLSKACFVAGDEAICVEYKKKAHRLIKENDEKNRFWTVYEQIEANSQNINLMKLHINAFGGLQSYNIKRAMYRGATIFISATGRLHSLQASSCFDIIDEWKETGECSEEIVDQLQFMVAVACEVRAKVYSKGQQDDVFMEGSEYEDKIQGFIKVVGKQSLVSFVEAMMFLQETLNYSKAYYGNGELKFKGIVVKKTVCDFKFEALLFLRLNEDVVELSKQTISLSQVETFSIDIVAAAFQRNEYDLVIKMCSKVNTELTVNEKFKYKVYELASIVNRSYNKEIQCFEGSRSEVEDKVKELEQMAEKVVPEHANMNLSLKTYSDAFKLLKDSKIPDNSKIHKLREDILKLVNDRNEFTVLCISVGILMKKGKHTEAWKLLGEAEQLMQLYKNTTTWVHMVLYLAYEVYYHDTNTV